MPLRHIPNTGRANEIPVGVLLKEIASRHQLLRKWAVTRMFREGVLRYNFLESEHIFYFISEMLCVAMRKCILTDRRTGRT